MAGDTRQMHLGVSIIGVGSHPAAWRLRPSDAPVWSDIEHYKNVAKIAERGTFDLVMIADVPEVASPDRRPPLSGLEPTLLIAVMAEVTDRIGFVGTVSTTFNEPYNLARRFASLDHMSGGRVSINAITTYSTAFAAHFGSRELPSHAVRYARAAEFLDVMIKFWDSWEDDAVIDDRKAGRFADAAKVHKIEHDGPGFSVRGTLPLPRSPQGRPVLTQSGASEEGRDLAARYAEIVYAAHVTLDDAQAYNRDLKERARRYGRPAGLPKVLLAVAPVVGATREAARARKAELDALADRSGNLAELAKRLGTVVSALDLDSELPDHVIAGASTIESGSVGLAQSLVNLAVREHLTVRQLLSRNDKFLPIIGAADDIADVLELWFRTGGADGFILNVDMLPSGLDDFVDLVVPELRRRGVFRENYAGKTLRHHLGLARPQSQYTASPLPSQLPQLEWSSSTDVS
jgi:FMN-dependent oxidoreductase (nitrilotriacetate monooxygenase family)